MTLAAPTFGELLRQLRRRVGLTQGELALVVGFSVAQISRLEKDERLPDLEMVVEKFLPALALESEPRLAQRLLELAATARGERVPTAIVAQRTVHTVVQETVVESDSHLPALLLPLVGRDQDVAVISKRIMEAPGRLLTLIGPPGVGKTQLAMTVAAKVQSLFLDGVYFVPLATVTDPDQVPSAIVTAVGFTENDQKTPRAKLIEHFRRKHTLLVLDNFEQVSSAAPLVTDLLSECARLRILVTSQEPLRLRIEQRQQVQPLVPAAAVELFLQRAQAIEADFETSDAVTAICLRLDCLPLAIELVAAQLELFTPAQILTRLQDHGLDLLADGPRDLPAHQRTLRNAIHRSYMLLTQAEQQLFRALGIFTGGCTLAALADVVDTPSPVIQADTNPAPISTPLRPEETTLLATLRTLVRKSLVQQQSNELSTRFDLLTTLSVYAREQLAYVGEEQMLRQQHFRHYLTLAQTAIQQMHGKTRKIWLDRLTVEQDNLRSALEWSLQQEPTLALQLVAVLGEFWATRGHDYEARRWIEQALAATPQATPARAAVLRTAGIFARRQADYGIAQSYMTESLELYQALGDQAGLAVTLREVGWLEYDLHHKTATLDHFYESLALSRALGDRAGIANLLLCLVHVLRSEPAHLAEVQAYLAESLAYLRELEQPEGLVWALQQQGELALTTGQYATAEAHFQEALRYWRQVDAKLNVAWGVALVGEAAAFQGDLATAATCYAEAHQIFAELGNKDGLANVLYHLGEVARQQENHAQAIRFYHESLTLSQTLQNRHILARCLAGFGSVALAVGEAVAAATLLGAAQRLFVELPPFLPPAAQAEVAQTIAATRQTLGEREYPIPWQVGQTMTTDAAIELAMATLVESATL